MADLVPVPDLINCVVGFRAWSPDPADLLQSRNGVWLPGPNKAICDQHATHDAPVHNCGCGLYAYHDLSRFDTNGTYGSIFGVVAAWGRMCVARDGFRAEFAQVVLLATPFTDSLSLLQAQEIADNYGVELVAVHELEQRAYEFGQPIPPELVPHEGSKKAIQKAQTALQQSMSPMPTPPFFAGRQIATRPAQSPTQYAQPIGVALPAAAANTPTISYIHGVPCVPDDRPVWPHFVGYAGIVAGILVLADFLSGNF